MRSLAPVAALGLVVLASAGGRAQTRPAAPLVFDDFAYADKRALLGPAAWATDLDGPAPGPGCAPGARCERLWYNGNWLDQGAAGDRLVVGDGRVRLQSLPGDTLAYGGPASHPPWIQTGFEAAMGTWVARVRFDPVRGPDARHGPAGDAPLLSQAFWVASVHYASRTAGWDRAASSEINHEWNNYFYTPRSNPSDFSTALSVDQFLAAGLTFDGECQGICLNGVATGGLFMAAPGARPLTCSARPAGGGPAQTLGERTCQDAFAAGDAVLLMQYDGLDLTWAARAFDAGGPGASDDRTLTLELRQRYGRRLQPVATMFSQILASPAFCREVGAPTRCVARSTVGFSVDWFLYSPDTALSLDRAAADVAWLQRRGLERVNTTGLPLAAPTVPPPPSAARLLPPAAGPAGAVPEWTVVPPPAWARRDGDYSNLSWRVEWAYRARRTARSRWSSWRPVEGEGFSVDAPAPASWDRVEVEVTLTDWHPGAHSTPVTLCRGLRRGGTDYACTGQGGARR